MLKYLRGVTMNVFAKHQDTQEFLESQKLNIITIVDNPLDLKKLV